MTNMQKNRSYRNVLLSMHIAVYVQRIQKSAYSTVGLFASFVYALNYELYTVHHHAVPENTEIRKYTSKYR